MALTQRLEIRQSHALVMTPQLMQAIKLLQLSNLDLATYVEGELERNPLLEQAGDGPGDTAGPAEGGGAGGGDSPAVGADAAQAEGAADWGERERRDEGAIRERAADLDD